MIRKVEIKNFRCFQNTSMTFKELSILVGKNNAGKSTLIEALRITSVVTNRYKNLNYIPSPLWIKTKDTLYGVNPSIDNLGISTQNIFYQYGNSPSRINVEFSNGVRIETYIGENAKIFSIIFDSNGEQIKNKKQANLIEVPVINILPQISPVLTDEKIIKYDTVQSNLLTRLSSRNFRNQIKYYNADFIRFKELAEKTWKGLSVDNIENLNGFSGDPLELWIRDGGFTAEIGWMGHGLQMWLQTIWFLARSNCNSIVILDEPDVYMHADLQRKLIRIIKSKYDQIIIATHSIEIMSEVEAENILPIDSTKLRLTFANKSPIVQKLIDDIGSVHNIDIVRLFSNKKFFIVEGDKDDIKILGIFQNKLYPDTNDPFDIIPKVHVEGWGGWQRCVGANRVFTETGLCIMVYCIFDSDYHTDVEKSERIEDAKNHNINLHIWGKKEIENFLLDSNVIHRIIKNKKRKGDISLEIINEKISEFSELMKLELYDDFGTEIQKKDNKLTLKTVNERAREYVDCQWVLNKLSLLPGKKLISKLSCWSQENYGVILNPFIIARNFNKSEIPEEIVQIVDKIEKGGNF
ncbi:MAG: ATP-binding protein [Bacteroidales bacterium]|nr:ATP-binding protein [Bacteroidales bacterium]